MGASRILVTGATGFLGPFVVRSLRARGHDVVTTARTAGDAAIDLAQRGSTAAVLEALRPEFVVNLAALSSMRECEDDPERAEGVNAAVPRRFAERLGDRLLHVSTDLVFDGAAAPYGEGALPGPLSAYARSKLAGEREVLAREGRVVRIPLLFGPDEQNRGATGMIRAAVGSRRPLGLYTNEYRTPLHAADAGRGLAELATLRGAPRLLHMPGPERCSRWDLGRRYCAAHGLAEVQLEPAECQDATRPRDVSLRGEWSAHRSFDDMLAEG